MVHNTESVKQIVNETSGSINRLPIAGRKKNKNKNPINQNETNYLQIGSNRKKKGFIKIYH